MKAASLSHLTAVSGANCAIVVGAVFALCAAVGVAARRAGGRLARRPRRLRRAGDARAERAAGGGDGGGGAAGSRPRATDPRGARAVSRDRRAAGRRSVARPLVRFRAVGARDRRSAAARRAAGGRLRAMAAASARPRAGGAARGTARLPARAAPAQPDAAAVGCAGESARGARGAASRPSWGSSPACSRRGLRRWPRDSSPWRGCRRRGSPRSPPSSPGLPGARMPWPGGAARASPCSSRSRSSPSWPCSGCPARGCGDSRRCSR